MHPNAPEDDGFLLIFFAFHTFSYFHSSIPNFLLEKEDKLLVTWQDSVLPFVQHGQVSPGDPRHQVLPTKINRTWMSKYGNIINADAKQVVLQYFLSFGGLSWGQSRVSFLSLGDKKHICFCDIGNSNPPSAQPSNKHTDESASCFWKRVMSSY